MTKVRPPRRYNWQCQESSISNAERDALVARAKVGDRDAANEVCRSMLTKSRTVARIARNMTRFNFDVAFSAALASAYLSISTFDPSVGVSFSAYASANMRWATIGDVRRFSGCMGNPPQAWLKHPRVAESVLNTVPVEPDDDADDDAPPPSVDDALLTDPAPETTLDNVNRIRLAMLLIEKLTPQERTVIRRRFLNEEDTIEVCERLEVSPGRVNQLEHNAIRKLSSWTRHDVAMGAI